MEYSQVSSHISGMVWSYFTYFTHSLSATVRVPFLSPLSLLPWPLLAPPLAEAVHLLQSVLHIPFFPSSLIWFGVSCQICQHLLPTQTWGVKQTIQHHSNSTIDPATKSLISTHSYPAMFPHSQPRTHKNQMTRHHAGELRVSSLGL